MPHTQVATPEEAREKTLEGSKRRTGRGKGLFTATLNFGIEPRNVGREVIKQDFEICSGTDASMGLLTEVIDALELEQGLDAVPSTELAVDLRKLALKVSYVFMVLL